MGAGRLRGALSDSVSLDSGTNIDGKKYMFHNRRECRPESIGASGVCVNCALHTTFTGSEVLPFPKSFYQHFLIKANYLGRVVDFPQTNVTTYENAVRHSNDDPVMSCTFPWPSRRKHRNIWGDAGSNIACSRTYILFILNVTLARCNGFLHRYAQARGRTTPSPFRT